MTLTDALNKALAQLTPDPKDQLLKEMALMYAEKMQFARDDDTLKKFGPELLKVLIELGLTPRSRSALLATVKEVATHDEIATFTDARASARERYSGSRST